MREAVDAQAQPALDIGQDVPLRVVGLVQGECFGLNRPPHVVRYAPVDPVLKRFAAQMRCTAPVGKDLLAQLIDLFWPDAKGILWASRQCVQLMVDPVDRAFRRNDAHAGQQAAVADDELVGIDGDAHVADEVQEHPGPADRHRLPLGLLIALGGIASPLDVHLSLRLQQALLETYYARCRTGRPPRIGREGHRGIGSQVRPSRHNRGFLCVGKGRDDLAPTPVCARAR